MNRRPSPPPPPEPTSPPGATDEARPRSSEGQALSFEAAIKRLTEIVQALEQGELPLEESLRLFEEGVRLSRVSQERLDVAEKRVEQLLAVDERGQAKTAPFATDAADDEDDAPF